MINKESPIPESIQKIIPNDKELSDDLMKVAKFTHERAIGVEDDITPHLNIFSNKDGEKKMIICAIAMPFNEWKEKSAVMEGLGIKAAEEGEIPTNIVLTSMAWMSNNTKVQPRHDKNKKEVILIMGLSSDMRALVTTAEVHRENNKVVKIDEFIEIGAATGDLLPCFYRGYAMKIMDKKKNEN